MTEFDCNFCESDHLFGERGECLDNETCNCPDGFSGKDDWLSFSGCQINESFQDSVHLILSSLSALGLMVSVICFWILLRRWDFSCSLFSKQKAQNFFSPPSFQQFSYDRSLQDLALRNWKRQVYTLYSVVAYIMYFIGGIIYSFSLLKQGNRQEVGVKFVIGMYIVLAASIPAGFLIVVVWYYALPNVSRFGGLLKMNWFLVRYPDFVPKSLLWTGICIEIVFFIFALVIPLTIEDENVLQKTDQVVVAALVWIIFVCFANLWLTLRTVERVFSAALKMFSSNESSNNFFDKVDKAELKFMKNVMLPLKFGKYTCLSVLLFDLLLEVTNLVTGATQTYIYINLNFIVFCIFMMSAPVCFVLLESFLTPKALAERSSTPLTGNASGFLNNSQRVSSQNL